MQKPWQFQKWRTPARWTLSDSFLMDCILDVIMHLIFLGIIQDCTDTIKKWAGTKGKHATFCWFADGLLEAIKNLSLDWCSPLAYKQGTLGGWVSSDKVTLAKLLPWFYSMVDEMDRDEDEDLPPYVAPPAKKGRWKRDQNKKWLELRAKDTKGSTKVLEQ